MKLSLRRFAVALSFLISCLVLSATAFAANGNEADRTQFGTDIYIGPNEQINDATCFGCSVRVRGHVAGGVTVFGGSVIVEDQGEVGGDVTNFGRGVRLEGGVKVGGDVTVFGGPVRRDANASVGGDVTSFNGSLWLLLVFGLPVAIFAGIVTLLIWLVRRLTRPSLPVAA